ncbi:phage virion morphogenesis protein [Pantoea sp. 1B4]|uniref:phage virion morphogenesis protein n=1 Tax=Pantoea sp. 1B4 TaxID=2804760 RepID=UPI001AA8ACFA|nr:phage virion morphogenesis protein [Pantoea sp. 1B4]MBN1089085.1 phage virion morphogenesis protein [Pantoea sp. 1B4]
MLLGSASSSLSAPARKQIARNIGRKLRARQQRNIKRQQSPDDTPFKPRKMQPVRSKKGRIRRELFAKMRTDKYMMTQASLNEAVIEFTGNVQRMARVHYGQRVRPSCKGKGVQYESRLLPSLKNDDYEAIINCLMEFLSK